MSHKDDLQKLIHKNHRRLQKLKERKAELGTDTPVYILTEIEDVEDDLEILHSKLSKLTTSNESGSIPITTSKKTSETSQNPSSSSDPLSIRNISAGIIITVLGGVILAFLIQQGRFTTNTASPQITNVATVVVVTPVLDLTPSVTSTPEPLILTNTPTSIPTVPIDIASITIYDDFNNPDHDGSFDKSQWRYWNNLPNPSSGAIQQNGRLTLTQNGGPTVYLAAREFNNFIEVPTFFEAKLMLSSDDHAGSVLLHIHASFPEDGGWYSTCRIEKDSAIVCKDAPSPWIEGHGYYPPQKLVDYDTWYTVRVEVDPETMMFTYYVDGEMLDFHVPIDADKLRKARFQPTIGVESDNGNVVVGYIDYVQMGQIEK